MLHILAHISPNSAYFPAYFAPKRPAYFKKNFCYKPVSLADFLCLYVSCVCVCDMYASVAVLSGALCSSVWVVLRKRIYCSCGFYHSMLLAMERSCRRLTSVCLSVCLSVTLMDAVTLVIPDHIRRARWNFITRLISPMSSLAARQISAI